MASSVVEKGGAPTPRQSYAARHGLMKRILLELKRNYIVYIVIVPIMLHFLVFQIVPFLSTFVISFLKWDYINPPLYVGLENWRGVFSDGIFTKALVNTFKFTIYFVPPVMVTGLVLALVINSRVNKFTFLRGMYFLPVVTSFVVLSAIWRWLFAADKYGIVNAFLESAGIPRQPFFNSSSQALVVLAVLSVYKVSGTMMVYYFGGLRNIPSSLYESGIIDGANTWQKFRYITWPLLQPTTVYVIVLATTWSFQVFDSAYLITGGGPNNSTQTIVYQIYLRAFTGFNGGYASMLSCLLFILIFFITYIQRKFLDKEINYI